MPKPEPAPAPARALSLHRESSLRRRLAARDEQALVELIDTASPWLLGVAQSMLSDPDEAYEIGLDEALDGGAALVEWPQRLEGRLPADRLDIEIAIEGEGRTARLTPHGAWKDRPLEF